MANWLYKHPHNGNRVVAGSAGRWFVFPHPIPEGFKGAGPYKTRAEASRHIFDS